MTKKSVLFSHRTNPQVSDAVAADEPEDPAPDEQPERNILQENEADTEPEVTKHFLEYPYKTLFLVTAALTGTIVLS